MSSQSLMTNAITEIEITLYNRKCRVTQAEDRLSELEDRRLEINEAKQEKKKIREMKTASETSGTMLNLPHFKSQVSRRKKTKGKGMTKYLRRKQLKTSLKWEREQTYKVKNPRVSHRDKSKTKHIKTHRNQYKYKQIIIHNEQILKATKE